MTRAKRGFGSVRIVLVGMIAVGALAIAGCGGSGSSSTGLVSDTSPASGVSIGNSASGVSTGNSASGSGGSSSAAPTDPGSTSGTGGTTGTVVNPPPVAAPANPSVSLAWAAPTENSDGTPLIDLKGFKIHYGTKSQNYTDSISVDNPTVTTYLVDSLPAGTYYFAVTAYNASGAESALSDEVQRSLN